MLILGHRGAIVKGASFSQNSLPAFEYALGAVDGFETDACLSQDGDVFLIHASDDGKGFGAYLDQNSAMRVGVRRIEQCNTQLLTTLRLAKREPIPTLRQAIELVGQKKGKVLNIELKSFGASLAVLDVVQTCLREKCVKPEALIISSFDHAALKKVRAELPKVKIGALFVSANEHGQKIFPSQQGAMNAYVTVNETTLASSLLRSLQPEFFVMPEKMLTAETFGLVERLHPKTQLCGWTVTESAGYDQADLIKRLKSLPQDKIGAMIVDNPRVFVQAWQNR